MGGGAFAETNRGREKKAERFRGGEMGRRVGRKDNPAPQGRKGPSQKKHREKGKLVRLGIPAHKVVEAGWWRNCYSSPGENHDLGGEKTKGKKVPRGEG